MPLDQDCLARFKLRQPPFDDLLSEEFLYTDPLLDSLVETATRALQAPGTIVILAGSDGSGRSTQLQRLLDPLSEQFELIAFRGRAHLPFEAIDATIRNHLKHTSAAAGARSLSRVLAEQDQTGAPAILAIDDAHLLGSDNIQQLLRVRSEVFEAGAQGLRLVLVGTVDLARKRLPLPDPADESQVVRLHLRPFNIEQTGAYLRHRLRVAGIEHPDTFLTGSDVASLQTSSRGLPGALNQNANAWLSRRCGGARDERKPQTVGEKFSHFVQSGREQRHAADSSLDAGREKGNPRQKNLKSDADVAPDVVNLQSSPDPQLSDYLVSEIRQSAHGNADFERIMRHVRQHQLEVEPKASEQKNAGDKSAVALLRKYWGRRWFIPALVAIALAAVLVPVVWQLFGHQPEQNAGPRATASEQTAGVDTGERQERAGPATNEDGRMPPAQTATVNASDFVGEQQARQRPPDDDQMRPYAAASDTDANDSRTLLESGEAWLQRQDSQRYTVQLVAARDFETARDFVQSHGLQGAHYIRTRTLVIAIIGSYPNRAEANRLLPRLSRDVRDNGPWIRTIEDVRRSQP